MILSYYFLGANHVDICRTTAIQPNQEELGHGDKLFPLATYHCVIPTAQFPGVPPHWHSEFEISLIIEGRANYKFGTEDYTTSPDDIIIIAPNTLHSIVPINGEVQVSDTIVFHLSLIGLSTPDQCTIRYLQPIFSGEYGVINHISRDHPGYAVIRKCFDDICELINQKPPYYELELKSMLTELFRLFYVNNIVLTLQNTHSHIRQNELIANILRYIDENYRSDLSIHSIASEFCLSDVYFMTYFRKTSGMTCNRYITEVRLREAGHMLLDTDKSVSEICFECGFRNLSNFNRRFREYYSVTPSEYKKMLK